MKTVKEYKTGTELHCCKHFLDYRNQNHITVFKTQSWRSFIADFGLYTANTGRAVLLKLKTNIPVNFNGVGSSLVELRVRATGNTNHLTRIRNLDSMATITLLKWISSSQTTKGKEGREKKKRKRERSEREGEVEREGGGD